MSLCALKAGRRISYAGRHRRPCLVAVIWPPARSPIVLLDVDHADNVALSSQALVFHTQLPLRTIEEPIKALLDGLIGNNGHWDTSVLEPFADICDGLRLPKVLRYQDRIDEAAYHKAWAMRLMDRLGIGSP